MKKYRLRKEEIVFGIMSWCSVIVVLSPMIVSAGMMMRYVALDLMVWNRIGFIFPAIIISLYVLVFLIFICKTIFSAMFEELEEGEKR